MDLTLSSEGSFRGEHRVDGDSLSCEDLPLVLKCERLDVPSSVPSSRGRFRESPSSGLGQVVSIAASAAMFWRQSTWEYTLAAFGGLWCEAK